MGMSDFQNQFHYALWVNHLGQFEEFKDEPFPLPQTFEEHQVNVRAYNDSEICKRNKARYSKLWEIRHPWSVHEEEDNN